jgi:hypothetical protein
MRFRTVALVIALGCSLVPGAVAKKGPKPAAAGRKFKGRKYKPQAVGRKVKPHQAYKRKANHA